MNPSAVIIVPSQGKHASMFESVAKTVAKKAYKGNALVVRTTVTNLDEDSFSVSLNTTNGDSFSWANVKDLGSVVTISHSGPKDGPNLAHGDDSIVVGGHQPWGTEWEKEDLTSRAKNFWRQVSKATKGDGKLILLGCYMGEENYAQTIATLTGRTAYASKDAIAAANTEKSLMHVRSIEKGVVRPPMKQFTP